MSRENLLANYLHILDENNKALNTAVEALAENASSIRMMIDELLHGAVENPYYREALFSEGFEPIHVDGETAEEVANKIIEHLNDNLVPGGNLNMISMPINVNPLQVMDLVTEKLKALEAQEEIKKEEVDDEINFDNPIE